MPSLDLSLPKRVRFNNYRLNRLYNLLMLLTLGGMLSKVIYFKEWFAYVEMKDYVKATLWVAQSKNFSSEVNSETRKRDFCTNSSKLDYWWSSDEMYRYENMTCATMCTSEQNQDKCWNQEELYSREETQTQVLFYSRMLEQIKPQGTRRQVLFPAVDLAGIHFRFEIKELVHDLVGKGFSLTGKTRSSTTDVLTVLRKSGRQFRILEPSPQIELSVEELLNMAGIPNALDVVSEIPGKNQKPGAFHPSGPTGRISGVELAMKIQCYNYHMWTIEGNDKWSSYNGPVCYIDTENSPIAWVTRETVDSNAQTVYRHFSGVRVKVFGGGDYRSINLDKMFASIIAVFVLARLPEKAVLFVAVHLLGHLSKIYNRVLFEPFSVQDAVSGLVLRLMTVQCLFNVLSSKRGMSKGTMMKRVQRAMEKEENLDQHELQVLVDLVFEHIVGDPEEFQTLIQEIASLGTPSFRAFTGNLQCEVKERPEESDNQASVDKRMDLQQFCHTYANQEAINFKDASVLFDKDRYISRAEKFFMPYSLRKLIWSQPKRSSRLSNAEESSSDEENEPPKHKNVEKSATNEMLDSGRVGPDLDSISRQGSKEVPQETTPLWLDSLAQRVETPIPHMGIWSADTCGKADLDFLEKKLHHAVEERVQQLQVCWEERIQMVAEEALSYNSQNQIPVHKTSSGLRLLSSLDTRLRDVETLIEEVHHQLHAQDKQPESAPDPIHETSKPILFENVLATAAAGSPFNNEFLTDLPAKHYMRTFPHLVPEIQLRDVLLANHGVVNSDTQHHQDTIGFVQHFESGSAASDRSTKEQIQLSSRPVQTPFACQGEGVGTTTQRRRHKL